MAEGEGDDKQVGNAKGDKSTGSKRKRGDPRSQVLPKNQLLKAGAAGVAADQDMADDPSKEGAARSDGPTLS